MIRITDSFPYSPLPFHNPIRKTQNQFYNGIENFKTKLQALDVIKAKDLHFLEDFASAVTRLNSIVEEIERSS